MNLNLKGKTAVVTGASQGFGRAITKELALEGVTVLAIARNAELMKSLKEEIVSEGGVLPITLLQDFVAPDAPHKIATAALDQLGHVDILINNAGRSQPLDIIGDDELWEASATLDFTRHRQLTQKLLPQFIERRQGAIVNITSTYELRSINASAVFKASIAVWSKQLSFQLGQYGVRVNSVQPGLIDTENIRRFFPGDERRKFAKKEIALGDFGEAQDIANMVTFLVSSRARYITGSVFTVDGGMRYYPF